MRRFNVEDTVLRFLAVVFAVSAFAAMPAGRAMADPVVGVNEIGLEGKPPAVRDATLADMARAGVTALRIPLHAPVAGVLETIRSAKAQGIAVVLDVSLNGKDFYGPDVALRSGQGRVENSYPLSRLDPDRFEASFGSFWQDLEQNGLRLLALEVGNEINWTFNGDIAVHAGEPGRMLEPGAAPAPAPGGVVEDERGHGGVRCG